MTFIEFCEENPRNKRTEAEIKSSPLLNSARDYL